MTVGERVEPFYTLHFPDDCLTLIEQYGHVPLPPYIEHDTTDDETRYQTVFAQNPARWRRPPPACISTTRCWRGSTHAASSGDGHAARRRGHVPAGAGRELAEHKMHSEWYHLPQALADKIAATRARGNRVIAVGTTSLRALEAAAREQARTPARATAETDMFITPGYHFLVVDRLVTNFHLPKSTLLMLVSAFAGVETIRARIAMRSKQRYRFFSYGDAMLLTRRDA